MPGILWPTIVGIQITATYARYSDGGLQALKWNGTSSNFNHRPDACYSGRSNQLCTNIQTNLLQILFSISCLLFRRLNAKQMPGVQPIFLSFITSICCLLFMPLVTSIPHHPDYFYQALNACPLFSYPPLYRSLPGIKTVYIWNLQYNIKKSPTPIYTLSNSQTTQILLILGLSAKSGCEQRFKNWTTECPKFRRHLYYDQISKVRFQNSISNIQKCLKSKFKIQTIYCYKLFMKRSKPTV